MNVMIALGLISIMLLVGMLLRAKIPFFRMMLVPATVIAGLVGLVVMNLLGDSLKPSGVDTGLLTNIVNILFTLSFISIALTRAPKQRRKEGEDSTAKSVAKGSLGMGLIWDILYALTPVAGAMIIMVVGSGFGMDKIYGLLIQFGFAQGPGQAATYGTIFEQYGWKDAAMVGMTFAVTGFIAAFLIGVPIAKMGLRRKIARNGGKATESVSKGYFPKEEQRETMGKVTTYSGNVETMAYHFALMGVCFLLAIGISKLFALIPGFLGSSMSGMLFMCGMFAGYIVNFVTKKLKIDHLQNNTLQSKITGWMTDFLVIASFMSVRVSVVGKWIVPILAECIVVALITIGICMYFGQRLGGQNDFERTLGLYGTSTGTVPSGIALIRMVDPRLKTTTATELGMMNIPMMASTITVMVVMAVASHSMDFWLGMGILIIQVPVFMLLLRVFRCWGKKSYSFNKKWLTAHADQFGGDHETLHGSLRQPGVPAAPCPAEGKG